jgi:hypothetical protein
MNDLVYSNCCCQARIDLQAPSVQKFAKIYSDTALDISGLKARQLPSPGINPGDLHDILFFSRCYHS